MISGRGGDGSRSRRPSALRLALSGGYSLLYPSRCIVDMLDVASCQLLSEASTYFIAFDFPPSTGKTACSFPVESLFTHSSGALCGRFGRAHGELNGGESNLACCRISGFASNDGRPGEHVF